VTNIYIMRGYTKNQGGYTKNQLEKMERQYQKEKHERLQKHYHEALEREELERRNNGHAQVPHSEDDNQALSSDSQGPIVDSQEPSSDSQGPIVDLQEPSGDSQGPSGDSQGLIEEPRRRRKIRQRIDNGDGTFSYEVAQGGSKKKRQSKRTKRTRRNKKNKRTTKKR